MSRKGIGQGRFFDLCFLLILFCFPWSASAEEAPRIALSTGVEKEVVVEKDGRQVTERIPLDKASPGEILVYTITYNNEGKTVAKDILVTDPIPTGTIYVLDSAEGKDAQITFSIDGGRTYSKPPVKYKTKRQDGREEETEAPAALYTHVKWVIAKNISPEQSGAVSFKVRIK